jgi:hypothetical protein
MLLVKWFKTINWEEIKYKASMSDVISNPMDERWSGKCRDFGR